MKKRIFKGTGLILLLLVLFVLSNAVVITRANEYVLIKQFGKVVRVEENAGPSLCIPFLQTVQRVPKHKMISDLYPSDVTTKDKKVMTVDSFVIWDISDPVKYLSSLNASKEKAEIRLGNVVYNSIKTVLSSTNQADIISGRDGELAQSITDNIGNSMDSYGIHIYAVETKKLDLPDSNKESVYQRMISERNNIAAQYTADGDYQSPADQERDGPDGEGDHRQGPGRGGENQGRGRGALHADFERRLQRRVQGGFLQLCAVSGRNEGFHEGEQ